MIFYSHSYLGAKLLLGVLANPLNQRGRFAPPHETAWHVSVCTSPLPLTTVHDRQQPAGYNHTSKATCHGQLVLLETCGLKHSINNFNRSHSEQCKQIQLCLEGAQKKKKSKQRSIKGNIYYACIHLWNGWGFTVCMVIWLYLHCCSLVIVSPANHSWLATRLMQSLFEEISNTICT